MKVLLEMMMVDRSKFDMNKDSIYAIFLVW